jgi:hypothetical protein
MGGEEPSDVFVSSDLCPEFGLIALVRSIARAQGKSVITIIIPMSEIRAPETLRNAVTRALEGRTIKALYLFGDYWINDEFLKSVPEVNYMFFNGESKLHGFENHFTSPTTFVFHALDYKGPIKNYDWLDWRCMGTHVEETQHYISGLMNYAPFQGLLLVDRFEHLFDDPSGHIERRILEIGKDVVRYQITLVEERIKENSAVRPWGKLLVAVSAASEFINLTHDELHKQYPQVFVTCTLKLWIKGAHMMLAYSFRSWDKSIDVLDLVKPLGGGGSPSAAGLRLSLGQTLFDE